MLGVKEKGCLSQPEISEYCFKLMPIVNISVNLTSLISNEKQDLMPKQGFIPGRKQKDLAKLDTLGEWDPFTTSIEIDSYRIKIRIK